MAHAFLITLKWVACGMCKEPELRASQKIAFYRPYTHYLKLLLSHQYNFGPRFHSPNTTIFQIKISRLKMLQRETSTCKLQYYTICTKHRHPPQIKPYRSSPIRFYSALLLLEQVYLIEWKLLQCSP